MYVLLSVYNFFNSIRMKNDTKVWRKYEEFDVQYISEGRTYSRSIQTTKPLFNRVAIFSIDFNSKKEEVQEP